MPRCIAIQLDVSLSLRLRLSAIQQSFEMSDTIYISYVNSADWEKVHVCPKIKETATFSRLTDFAI